MPITATEGEHHGQPAHADIVVPPLATVWFRKEDGRRPDQVRWIILSIPIRACGMPPIFGSGKKHMTTYWPAGRS